MLDSRRKFVLGLLVLLGAGALIGNMYGRTEVGLLVAALLALAWQVRQLLTFEGALRSGDFDAFRVGEGIWQQIFSRFSYEHERGSRYKSDHRRLLKEIRKSTNAMPDGAVIIDCANEIVVLQSRGEGPGRPQAQERPWPACRQYSARSRSDKAVAGERCGAVCRYCVAGKDGGWLNCRVVPYGADQKLLLLRDVTERMVSTRCGGILWPMRRTSCARLSRS